jgi:hypothetical protein
MFVCVEEQMILAINRHIPLFYVMSLRVVDQRVAGA